jgi:hypothetical protein
VVCFEVGLDVLLHGERHIRVADAVAQRLPVDLGVPASGGITVPDIVQVDLGQPGRRGELLEPPCDRVRMRRPAVWPAEQHAVILVVLAEVAPLLVELLDVRLEDGQGERVERQDVLSVLGLAVRFDHPAVRDDAGHVDRERARAGLCVSERPPGAPARSQSLAAMLT